MVYGKFDNVEGLDFPVFSCSIAKVDSALLYCCNSFYEG